MPSEAVGVAQASRPAAAARRPREMALENGRFGWVRNSPIGNSPIRNWPFRKLPVTNLADLAAPGGSVVGESRPSTQWKSKTQQVLEKNVRAKKLARLYGLQEQMRLLTVRIENLEDELDLLGYKPRASQAPYKSPYREELVKELCALSDEERARRIRALAAREGIAPRSVYRKLQKCVCWSLRKREHPAWETKSKGVVGRGVVFSDVR